MLILAPSSVTFNSTRIEHVDSIAIEHASAATIVEYSDSSPDPAFADVSQRRTTIKLVAFVRRESGQPLTDPSPGTLGALTFAIGPSRTATIPAAMVTSASYQFANLPKGVAARRVLEFLAIAPDGAPILTMSGGAA